MNWGSLIVAMIFAMSLGGTISAQAEEPEMLIEWEDVPPLPITDQSYSPPSWVTCQEVEVASVAPSWVIGCTSEPEVAAGVAQVVVFEKFRIKLTRVADVLGDNTTLDYMIKAAEAKRQIIESIEELGMTKWPSSSILYAITDLPVASPEGEVTHDPHMTLVVRFDIGDVVLDGRHPYVMPWTCFPGRFEGIQSPKWTGKWLAVKDDRHEPEEMATKCACSVLDCPTE